MIKNIPFANRWYHNRYCTRSSPDNHCGAGVRGMHARGVHLLGEAGYILVDVCYIHAEAERNLEDVESIPVVADRTPGEVSRNLAGEVHILVGAVHSLVGVGHSLGVIDKVVVCPITVNQNT